jgi:hypothetical protein
MRRRATNVAGAPAFDSQETFQAPRILVMTSAWALAVLSELW